MPYEVLCLIGGLGAIVFLANSNCGAATMGARRRRPISARKSDRGRPSTGRQVARESPISNGSQSAMSR
jgi:hypothetical protein